MHNTVLHNIFMKEAYNEAILAKNLKEVPIGCVIVYNNKIIGRGFNKTNYMKNILYHAELEAIKEASKYIKDWRLEKTTLYVTLEPCPMCAGAIVQSRISTLVYGASSKKSGAFGSILNILQNNKLNHSVSIIKGIMEDECSLILREFFSTLRNKNINNI